MRETQACIYCIFYFFYLCKTNKKTTDNWRNIRSYSFIFLKYFLLFRYFNNSIQSTEPTVAIRIAVIAFHAKAVVLKMDCKKGTYTINNCRMTVSTIAPHNSLFANILEENRE